MSDLPLVVVGLSGGVDSSVAAALLVQQGYPVAGVMLRLWSSPGEESTNRCCTPDAMAQARRVAAQLGIPFYAIDAQTIFRQVVVQSFLDGYAGGLTPNPCLMCNRRIRWGFMLNYALSMGAQFMATGHYARLRNGTNGNVELLRGLDPAKDQSYVLSVLSQEQISHTLLPLGEYTKPQVRQLARDFGLPVAERAESQDLCFLAGKDYRDFLQEYAPGVVLPGPILSRDGKEIGQHQGLAFYTIGQRKGLKIAAPGPLYVLGKDFLRNSLLVGTRQDLGWQQLIAGQVNWVAGMPPEGPFRAHVQIRYRAEAAPGLLTLLEDGRFIVQFDHALRDITPGQSAVVYREEICLGSGIIEEVN
jgi:tRNA-uridine 2-sulfurtransferase